MSRVGPMLANFFFFFSRGGICSLYLGALHAICPSVYFDAYSCIRLTVVRCLRIHCSILLPLSHIQVPAGFKNLETPASNFCLSCHRVRLCHRINSVRKNPIC